MGKTRSYSVNDAPGGVKLKRELGLFSAVNLILGVMIGSGIFVSTSSALEHSGSVGMCIAIWIVCGIISLLGKNTRLDATYIYLTKKYLKVKVTR